MNRLIILCITLSILIGAALLFVLNKPSSKQQSFTIGLVNPNPGTIRITQGFIDGLASYGYVEGKKVTYIRCDKKEQIQTSLASMAAKPVDLIFTVTTPATKQAKKIAEGLEIPIIFVMQDPVSSHIINNLSNPGINISGIKIRGNVEKSLEWLLKIAPDTRHVLIPIRYDTKAANLSVADFRSAATKAGIKLTVIEVKDKTEEQKTLAALPPDIDAMFLLHSMLISSSIEEIAQAAIKMKIPLGGAIGKAEEGALFSFSPDLGLMGKQASRLSKQVLEGGKPQIIPAEMARYYLVINLKIAKKIGITISNDHLLQADKVIR
jgi:putative ABC transport system substrate-binding protein